MGPTVYKLQINITDWAVTALAHSPAFSAELWEEVHVSEKLNMQERSDTHTHTHTHTQAGSGSGYSSLI